ncbi:MAG: C10 family peptidase [Paludibacteraceae bacterium]|nr:C10 family peptidase [Paludibacteraceae bacterium]
MKKLTLCAVCLSACFAALFAAPRTPQQALYEAELFARQDASPMRRMAMSAPMKLAYTAVQPVSGQPAYYVFNRGQNAGFVIVAADDCTETVIAYADEGTFVSENMPDNVAYWMQRIAASVEQNAQRPVNPLLKTPKRQKANFTPILLSVQTRWNQGYPYNIQCPMDGDYNSVTGCVATACAQVMKFYNWPVTGTGSHSYYWDGGEEGPAQTLSANFGATTYDWTNMLNTYNSTATSTQQTAVATLMSHCGIACEMGYSASGSGAFTEDMAQALYTYFGYDSAVQVIRKDYMTAPAFLDIIYDELQAGRPMLMDGATVNNEGHCFVCDGIDADGLVHINWGWGGSCDAYFNVNNLDPYDQGIGGAASGMAFTEDVSLFRGIRPAQGGRPRPTVVADNISLNYMRMAKTTLPRFTATRFMNYGVGDWSGRFVLAVYQNGALVGTYTDDVYDFSLGRWYYTSSYFIEPDLSSLPAGQYDAMLGVTMAGQSGCYPIYLWNHGEQHYDLTVTNDSLIFVNQQSEEDYSRFEYTDLSAYAYPDNTLTGSYRWNLQFETANFWNGGNNDGVLMFGIYTSSPYSIAGTYRYASSTDPGSMALVKIFSGNNSYYTEMSGSDGELTLVAQADGTYKAFFQYTVNGGEYQDTVVFAANRVTASNADTDASISLRRYPATAMSIQAASDMTDYWSAGQNAPIPYLIGGYIYDFDRQTAAQRASAGYTKFNLQEGAYGLYCTDIYWLDSTRFVTGNEIQQGDTIVVLATLSFTRMTPHVRFQKGYVYYDKRLAPDDPPVDDEISVNVYLPDDIAFAAPDGLYAWWWSNSVAGACVAAEPQGNGLYTVSVPCSDNQFQCLIVDRNVAVNGWDGAYQTYDSPLLNGGECLVVGYSDGARYALTSVDCSLPLTAATLPVSLQASTAVGNVTMSWTSDEGSLWRIEIYEQATGDLAYSTTVTQPTLSLYCNSSDTYIWRVRTMNDDYTPLSNWVSSIFACPANPYSLSNLQATSSDGVTYTFSWNCTPATPAYRLRIIYYSEDAAYYYCDSVITSTSLTLDLTYTGTYEWTVYAIESDGSILTFANGEDITIVDDTDYSVSITDFTSNGLTVTFEWTSAANVFQVTVFDEELENQLIDVEFVEGYSFTCTLPAEGTYYFYIRPVNDSYTAYLGAYQLFEFSVTAEPTDMEITEAEEQAVKLIRDNRLLIRRENRWFDAAGLLLR